MRRARCAGKEDGRTAAAAALPSDAECSTESDPWTRACVSLQLQDEQLYAIRDCDSSRTQLLTTTAWHPVHERAPRPVAGSGSCLVYDVRGAQALAMMVYDLALIMAINSRRADKLKDDTEMQVRACLAFSYAWRPEECPCAELGDINSARGGIELASWLSARQQAADMRAVASAASLIAQRWRARRGSDGEIHLAWWDSERTRRVGKLEAHVLFLQRLFRSAIAQWPRAWRRGGRAGTGRVFALPVHRCRGGAVLASDDEFAAQASRAERMLAWYDQYVTILRRLNSGETPKLLHLFGGGGGSSEGSRRAGASGICVDNEPQPDYERRFGKETFKLGDATSWSMVAKLESKHRFTACLASPPCKAYSRALSGGTSLVPKLIPLTRDLLRTFFRHWAIENVMGAAKDMSPSSAELFGQAFGLKVDRARKIESSFEVRIDEAVAGPGRALRKRTCLGRRRRWKRVDVFGRPEPDCCGGNIFAIQGRTPWRCTTAECAAAMDVDGAGTPLPAVSAGGGVSSLDARKFDEHRLTPDEATQFYEQGWFV